MALTSKQEKFVQGILSGKTQIDAYKDAYPKSQKWTYYAVASNANKLMDNPNIKDRLDYLKKAVEDEIVYRKTWDYLDSERALKIAVNLSLQDMRDNGVKQSTGSTLVSAVKELNDMMYKLKDYEDYKEFNRLKKDKLMSEINKNNNGDFVNMLGVNIIDDI